MREKNPAHRASALALMLLAAAGAHAQSCVSLSDCASAADAAQIVDAHFMLDRNGSPILRYTPGPVDYPDTLFGTYSDAREFTKADGTSYELLVMDLVNVLTFVPQTTTGEYLEPSHGFTIAMATEVRSDVVAGDQGAPVFGAFTMPDLDMPEPMFQFGQAAPHQWYFRRLTQALGDQQSTFYTVLPWDPVPAKGDWVMVYVTFQADGKLRIDQLSLINGEWDTALLEDGWPIKDLGQVGANGGEPSPVIYFDWGDFFMGSPFSKGARFAQLLMFERALSPNEILAHHWSRTGLKNIKLDMQPCNTGLYMNGSSVNTPCGPKSPSQ